MMMFPDFVSKQGDDTTHIFVNGNDRPVRKRFTIAREIGHFVQVTNSKHQAFTWIEVCMSFPGAPSCPRLNQRK
ncbi:MAG: ImmA/IrrE family metallo-endopeptidase [Acidobacteria bacterium]|nr:ImmA/IrrE family metallo-endopeptidase [Acidobacteriota bacterium]